MATSHIPIFPTFLASPEHRDLLELLTDDDLDLSDVLVPTNIENLSILPAGDAPSRATELLASEQMATLLRELPSRYADRIIVFDSPPLLPTTEARVLASTWARSSWWLPPTARARRR